MILKADNVGKHLTTFTTGKLGVYRESLNSHGV